MENPIKMDDLGVPPFKETPISFLLLPLSPKKVASLTHDNIVRETLGSCCWTTGWRGGEGDSGMGMGIRWS